MSLHTAEVIDLQGILAENLHFIQKPFERAALHSKIQSILQSPH